MQYRRTPRQGREPAMSDLVARTTGALSLAAQAAGGRLAPLRAAVLAPLSAAAARLRGLMSVLALQDAILLGYLALVSALLFQSGGHGAEQALAARRLYTSMAAVGISALFARGATGVS